MSAAVCTNCTCSIKANGALVHICGTHICTQTTMLVCTKECTHPLSTYSGGDYVKSLSCDQIIFTIIICLWLLVASACLTSSEIWDDGDDGPATDPPSVFVSQTEGNAVSFISKVNAVHTNVKVFWNTVFNSCFPSYVSFFAPVFLFSFGSLILLFLLTCFL